MRRVKEHAQVIIIACLIAVFAYQVADTIGRPSGQAQVERQQVQDSRPGPSEEAGFTSPLDEGEAPSCSYDGNFDNDAPGCK